MATTVAAGSSATFEIGPFDTITLASGGVGTLVLTSQAPKLVADQRLSVQNGTFGPWGAPMSVALSVTSGGVDYTVNPKSLTATQSAALVSSAGSPTDLLTGPLQHVTITGAISTTAAQAAAATGTYYKARVAWNNNGASASAKLRIAVNADNDVHGLMIGQNVKRRDYEMTMGDGVMLVCGVPITRLTFSADGSITGGTHQLQVTFGN